MSQGPAKTGLTPAKGALIAVLVIALGAVWLPQLVGGAEETAERESASRSQRSVPIPSRNQRANTRQQPTTATADKPPAPDHDMPAFTLSEAAAYDPFAASNWVSSPEPSVAPGTSSVLASGNLEQRFEALKASRLGMVIVSAEGGAAQIGDKTVRVGDEIDGFRVVEITTNNIVFRPATTGEEAERGS